MAVQTTMTISTKQIREMVKTYRYADAYGAGIPMASSSFGPRRSRAGPSGEPIRSLHDLRKPSKCCEGNPIYLYCAACNLASPLTSPSILNWWADHSGCTFSSLSAGAGRAVLQLVDEVPLDAEVDDLLSPTEMLVTAGEVLTYAPLIVDPSDEEVRRLLLPDHPILMPTPERFSTSRPFKDHFLWDFRQTMTLM